MDIKQLTYNIIILGLGLYLKVGMADEAAHTEPAPAEAAAAETPYLEAPPAEAGSFNPNYPLLGNHYDPVGTKYWKGPDFCEDQNSISQQLLHFGYNIVDKRLNSLGRSHYSKKGVSIKDSETTKWFKSYLEFEFQNLEDKLDKVLKEAKKGFRSPFEPNARLNNKDIISMLILKDKINFRGLSSRNKQEAKIQSAIKNNEVQKDAESSEDKIQKQMKCVPEGLKKVLILNGLQQRTNSLPNKVQEKLDNARIEALKEALDQIDYSEAYFNELANKMGITADEVKNTLKSDERVPTNGPPKYGMFIDTNE